MFQTTDTGREDKQCLALTQAVSEHQNMQQLCGGELLSEGGGWRATSLPAVSGVSMSYFKDLYYLEGSYFIAQEI